MYLPHIPLFQLERWAVSSTEDRIQAIQDAEKQLAENEHRTPCEIRLLPQDMAKVVNGGYIAGEHRINPSTGLEEIRLNPLLLENNSPYPAVQTLYHEAEHAFQTHAINHPEDSNLKAKVNDWAENKEVYFPPASAKEGNPEYTLDNALYRYQPLEVDAENVAWERMDATYLEYFKDDEGYRSFRDERMQQAEIEHIYAEGVMGGPGTDVEQKAAQIVHEQYLELNQAQNNDLDINSQISDTKEKPEFPNEIKDREITKTEESNLNNGTEESDLSGESEEQDENRYYGYGY